jgi:hypothetical protein
VTNKRSSKAAPVPNGYITTEEAAKIMCITTRGLHNMRADGRGPKAVKINGRFYYDAKTVNAFPNKQKSAACWENREPIVLNWKAPKLVQATTNDAENEA